MARDTLDTLVGLRRAAERRALGALAERMSEVERARGALGGPPAPMGLSGEVLFSSLDEQRLASGMAWAVWGERLGRLERAGYEEDRTRGEWVAAAADLRATQRLAARRRRLERVEAARRDQVRLDEVAVTVWNRGRGQGMGAER